MTLPRSVAEKLLLLAEGSTLPSSKLKHAITDELVEEGIIAVTVQGRTKSTLQITDLSAFNKWLYNKFSISNLADFINVVKNDEAIRSGMVEAANNSKTRSVRTFKGFLVNSYAPVVCTLNGAPYTVHPAEGTFQFIYDCGRFIPAADVVIVGVENAENFRFIQKQKYLFGGQKTLFVCRYPQEQSKDLVKWLQAIPNAYLHFGDYDFAGINIYMHEYKKHLGGRASFFIPQNIEHLVSEYGNSDLYDKQSLHNNHPIMEANLRELIILLHKYKRGLEQEALLIGR
jgi:hypothetical protein